MIRLLVSSQRKRTFEPVVSAVSAVARRGRRSAMSSAEFANTRYGLTIGSLEDRAICYGSTTPMEKERADSSNGIRVEVAMARSPTGRYLNPTSRLFEPLQVASD